jgi:ketosteroid isomerase-like protein
MTNIDIARHYLALLTDPASTAQQLDAVLHAEITVEEAPNLVAPMGRTRDHRAIHEGFARSKGLLTEQEYRIESAVEIGDRVILEVGWRGVLAQGFGKVAAGTEMRARCAMFLQFRDGKIVSQRNYDCYEPVGA